eukprot:3296-Amphidinium_carterae.1
MSRPRSLGYTEMPESRRDSGYPVSPNLQILLSLAAHQLRPRCTSTLYYRLIVRCKPCLAYNCSNEEQTQPASWVVILVLADALWKSLRAFQPKFTKRTLTKLFGGTSAAEA